MLRTYPTTREPHELYEVLVSRLYRGTVYQPIASESGRWGHRRALVEAGRLAPGEIGQTYRWRVADCGDQRG